MLPFLKDKKNKNSCTGGGEKSIQSDSSRKTKTGQANVILPLNSSPASNYFQFDDFLSMAEIGHGG